MGDGPRMTMGFGRRYNAVDGVPGQKPTYVSAPGPGAYEVVAKDSAFGTPALANRSTSPTTRIGNATRQAERKKFEPEFERDLLGQHSPPPTTYLPPADVGFPRKIRAPSAKFGTAFRWSIGGSTVYKAGSGKQPPRAKEVVPGPGQYVV